jgi:hypothetical protein
MILKQVVPGGRAFFCYFGYVSLSSDTLNSRSEYLSCDVISDEFIGLMSTGTETET